MLSIEKEGTRQTRLEIFLPTCSLRLAPLSLVENEQPLARARFLGSAGYRTTLCPDVRFINLHERPEPVQPAPTPRKSVIDKVYRMAGGYEKGRGRGWTSTTVAAIFPRSSGE